MPRRRADRFAAARGSGMRGARRGRPPGRRPCGSGRSGGPHPPARGGSWLPTRRAAHHWPALANFRTGVPVGRRCSRPLAGSATWAIAEATPVDMSSYTVFTRARGPASPRRLPSTGGATGPVAERTLGRRGCRARGRPVLVRRCSAESGSPKGALTRHQRRDYGRLAEDFHPHRKQGCDEWLRTRARLVEALAQKARNRRLPQKIRPHTKTFVLAGCGARWCSRRAR